MSDEPRKVSIGEQISELQRELLMRADVYPRQVRAGKIRESVANYQIDRMRAALRTLEWVQANREAINEKIIAPPRAGSAGAAS